MCAIRWCRVIRTTFPLCAQWSNLNVKTRVGAKTMGRVVRTVRVSNYRSGRHIGEALRAKNDVGYSRICGQVLRDAVANVWAL